MAQISKGDTFADGQQLTATRLNQLVDSSSLLVGAITEQSAMTANTLEATDAILVSDAGVLKKATIGDALNSNLSASFDVSTSNTAVALAINGKANKDINVTPNDGVAVTGKSFTSVDGITATVTSTAHGLESNMLLDVTASNAVYTGQHIITVVSVDTFSFVISQTTPVAASGTLSYTKKGSIKVIGNQHISNQLTVAGKVKIDGSIVSSGSNTLSGSTVISSTGSLSILGSMTNKSLPFFAVRAFGRYNTRTAPNGALSFTTNPTQTAQGDNTFGIHSAGNIASITKTASGYVTVVMTTPMPDCNYTVLASAKHNIGVAYGNSVDAVIINPSSFYLIVAQVIPSGQYDAEVNFTVIA